MKKIYLFFIAISLLFNNQIMAQGWLPVGSTTPYVVGTYSVNNKAYALFTDSVNNVLYASGQFDTAGTVNARGVAVWNDNAWAKRGMETVNFNVFCWYNGELYAGGQFTSNAELLTGLVKWNGSAWVKVEEVTGNIGALAVYQGDLYVAGVFDAIGGVTTINIAKYNGSGWTAIPAGTAGSDKISDLLVFNGDLYIAGAKELGKWNGNTFTDLHLGLSMKAYALEVYKGELFVGGGGGVAKFTGSSWAVIGGGTDKDVFDLKEFNGYLYAGGQFSTINSQSIKKMACWNGSAWSSTGNLSDVFNMAVYNKHLYAVGDFGAARLNATASIFEQLYGNVGAVYPNPSSGMLTIHSAYPTTEIQVTVTDLYGKEIHRSVNPAEIDLGFVAKGYYLVKLQSGTQVQSHKVLIK